jgi:signal transduction histidine kinase
VSCRRVSSAVSQPTPVGGGPLRRWRRPSRREVGYDLVLGGALAAITTVEALLVDGTGQDGPPSLAPSLAVALVTVAVTVAARRTVPVLSMLTACAVASWLGVGNALAVVMTYGVGYRVTRAGRAAAAVAFAAVVPTVIGWYLVLRHRGPEFDLTLILAVVVAVTTVSALLGRYRRQRAALVAAGWERAERLAHERDLIADQARLRERSRIAQDMHDSLGHELSLIALQAGALELDDDLPDRHRETARLLRASTADAVGRLREIVGLLRDDGEPAPTQPAEEGVAALVDRAAACGVDIRLVQDGEPAPLAPLIDRAVYRTVQESVTNATKHAPGAAVLVRLRHDTDEITVEVTNGPASEPAPEGGHGGRGLLALAERVRLVGGRLTAGPDGDGFRVSARLPRHGGVSLTADGRGDDVATELRAPALPRFTPPQGELALVDSYPSVLSQLRRRFWFKLAVPAVVLAILVGGYVVVFGLRQATMLPAQFETTRIGQAQSAIEATVPAGTPDPPRGFGPVPAPPAGTTCRYYVPRSGGWFDFDQYDPDRVFRLCYRDGRLASREVLPKAGSRR